MGVHLGHASGKVAESPDGPCPKCGHLVVLAVWSQAGAGCAGSDGNRFRQTQRRGILDLATVYFQAHRPSGRMLCYEARSRSRWRLVGRRAWVGRQYQRPAQFVDEIFVHNRPSLARFFGASPLLTLSREFVAPDPDGEVRAPRSKRYFPNFSAFLSLPRRSRWVTSYDKFLSIPPNFHGSDTPHGRRGLGVWIHVKLPMWSDASTHAHPLYRGSAFSPLPPLWETIGGVREPSFVRVFW